MYGSAGSVDKHNCASLVMITDMRQSIRQRERERERERLAWVSKQVVCEHAEYKVLPD